MIHVRHQVFRILVEKINWKQIFALHISVFFLFFFQMCMWTLNSYTQYLHYRNLTVSCSNSKIINCVYCVLGLSVPLPLLFELSLAAATLSLLVLFDKLATSFSKLCIRVFKTSTLFSWSFSTFFILFLNSFSTVKCFALSSVI